MDFIGNAVSRESCQIIDIPDYNINDNLFLQSSSIFFCTQELLFCTCVFFCAVSFVYLLIQANYYFYNLLLINLISFDKHEIL